MGWAVGWDTQWQRDVGYGVPAICDHPDCSAEIDRGLSYVCGGEPFGGDDGCGLFFCGHHQAEIASIRCERCATGAEPFTAKADTVEWLLHKATDPSWAEWRDTHPAAAVEALQTEAGRTAVASAAARCAEIADYVAEVGCDSHAQDVVERVEADCAALLLVAFYAVAYQAVTEAATP